MIKLYSFEEKIYSPAPQSKKGKKEDKDTFLVQDKDGPTVNKDLQDTLKKDANEIPRLVIVLRPIDQAVRVRSSRL